MPIPAVSYSSYDLINGALLSVGKMNSLADFYKDVFANKFDRVTWSTIFDKGAGSISEDYSQVKSEKGLPVIARIVAYDGEAPKISNEGLSISSNTMPRFKLGFDTNEMAIREQLKIANLYGGTPAYNQIYEKFVVDNAKIIGGIHSAINHAAYQVESTGAFTTTSQNNGGGLIGLNFDFNVPAANKKKAGGFGSRGTKYAWSSSDANPIGDLQDMCEYAENNFIEFGVIRMNKSTWNVLKNHPNTIKLVAAKMVPGVAATSLALWQITEGDLTMYLEGLGLPPVEVVDDYSSIEVYDEAQRKLVRKRLRGFADNTVLLRPSGSVGTLQWSLPTLDFATSTDPTYMVEDGLISVSKFTSPKNKSMEFVAEATCMPVLSYPDYMLYLDISQAAE